MQMAMRNPWTACLSDALQARPDRYPRRLPCRTTTTAVLEAIEHLRRRGDQSGEL